MNLSPPYWHPEINNLFQCPPHPTILNRALSVLLCNLLMAACHESGLLCITSFHLSYSPICRLQNYDATCRLAQEIAENIHERNRQQRTGGNPAKVTCDIHKSSVTCYAFLTKSLASSACCELRWISCLFRSTWHYEHHCRSSSRVLPSLRTGCCERHRTGACIPFFCKCYWRSKSWDRDYIWGVRLFCTCSSICFPVEGIRVFSIGQR